MKRFLLIILLHLSSSTFSQEIIDTTQYKYNSLQFSTNLGISILNSSFNVAGNLNGTNPNILSEIKWKNLLTTSSSINAAYTNKTYTLEIKYFNATVLKGDVSDIDYTEDFRKSPFSELYLASYDGNLNNFNINFKKSINLKNGILLSPMISAKYQINKLFLQNNKHTSLQSTNYIQNLNSYYKSNYPSIGFGFSLKLIRKKLEYELTTNYNYLKYTAIGSWNTRSDFQQPKSYSHHSKGNEIFADLSIVYHINNYLQLGIGSSYINTHTSNGTDKVFNANGTILSSKLNTTKMSIKNYYLKIKYSIKSDKY